MFGVNGKNVEETITQAPFSKDDIVPLIEEGTIALAGEFQGKVSINKLHLTTQTRW